MFCLFRRCNLALLSNMRNYGNLSKAKQLTEVKITDACINRLKQMSRGQALRVLVEGGGCSGFQYKFSLDEDICEDDKIFDNGEVRVVIDETSLQYLKGASIDYHSELIKSSFRVVMNPLAEKGCSCGASFQLKVD